MSSKSLETAERNRDRARANSVQNAQELDPITRERSIRVLDAVSTYYAAESAMRRRSQSAMGMNENDLSAMRFLLRATERGRDVGPKELARYLGLTSSSVTALLDRLERAGHVKRSLSPFDRRSLLGRVRLAVIDRLASMARTGRGSLRALHLQRESPGPLHSA